MKSTDEDFVPHKPIRVNAKPIQQVAPSVAPTQEGIVTCLAPSLAVPTKAPIVQRYDGRGSRHKDMIDDAHQRHRAGDQQLADAVGIVLSFMASVSPSSSSPTSGRGEAPFVDAFRSSRLPRMPIRDYFQSILQTFDCSLDSYVIALIYIDRVVARFPTFVVDAYSIHRLFLVGVVLALKYHDDDHHCNAHYANEGGLSLRGLNALELNLLTILQWRLHVENHEFTKYRDMILLAVPKKHRSVDRTTRATCEKAAANHHLPP
jgi:hypothetical protein